MLLVTIRDTSNSIVDRLIAGQVCNAHSNTHSNSNTYTQTSKPPVVDLIFWRVSRFLGL